MNEKIRKNPKFKNFFYWLFFVSVPVLIIYAVASASPPTSPYNPGETLSPSCSPGDANCTVLTPVNSLFNVSTSTISLVAGSNITLASTTNSITISASAGGLSSTTPWTAGNLAQVSSDSVLTSIATSSLGLPKYYFISPCRRFPLLLGLRRLDWNFQPIILLSRLDMKYQKPLPLPTGKVFIKLLQAELRQELVYLGQETLLMPQSEADFRQPLLFRSAIFLLPRQLIRLPIQISFNQEATSASAQRRPTISSKFTICFHSITPISTLKAAIRQART